MDAGDIFARSSENFLAIKQPFPSKLLKMLVIQSVSNWNEGVIPAIISCFISASQQNRLSSRIKSIERPVRTAFVLRSQFPHVPVLRPVNSAAVRKP